jgi:cytochrome b involved in lipid metabolism
VTTDRVSRTLHSLFVVFVRVFSLFGGKINNLAQALIPLRTSSRLMAPRDGSKAMLPSYTWQDVAKHNTEASAWVIYKDGVFDLTGNLGMPSVGQRNLDF